MEENKFPRGMTLLESSFSSNDVGNKKDKEEESKIKIGSTILVNIGTHDDPNNFKIGVQCLEKEKIKFMELLYEFKYVFAGSYEDLCGFDHNVIRHVIHIKEVENLLSQRNRPLNLSLQAIIKKEDEKLINAHIIFRVKYSEWVSNLVLVRKKNGYIKLCVYFSALNRASVKDKFPLLNMELILQQVARSQMMSLLDGF
jgi:hypothetical protein